MCTCARERKVLRVLMFLFVNPQLNEELSIVEIQPYGYLEVTLVTQEVDLMTMMMMIMTVASLDDCQTVHLNLLSATFDLKADDDSTVLDNMITCVPSGDHFHTETRQFSCNSRALCWSLLDLHKHKVFK